MLVLLFLAAWLQKVPHCLCPGSHLVVAVQGICRAIHLQTVLFPAQKSDVEWAAVQQKVSPEPHPFIYSPIPKYLQIPFSVDSESGYIHKRESATEMVLLISA